eukprot:TRINITY_DN72748_c0_g1_i1.p1 TRINITY_DN72748_c0_g1~~TRINITY_DN72748_c0_g1_i1.p1  ORF type:complete len:639 (+),score=97.27 TRINITY_DN72748_c0_g1_i1:132-2048(+)
MKTEEAVSRSKKKTMHSSTKKSEAEKPARLLANVAKTQYEVVKEVLEKNFAAKLLFDEASPEWDLLWLDTGITSAVVSKLKPYQKVNHFYGMSCLSRKNYLGKNMMRIRKMLPLEYDFIPQTWLLPAEWCDFKTHFDGVNTFILKPEALSQGKGIFLTNSYENIDMSERYIAQKYVHNPYLIDGLKFDMRIYVLVYGCDPLRIFVYKEGLARLATEEYVTPVGGNMENLYIHLTNYAINKGNGKFVFNKDADKTDVGHKRSLSFVWGYIDEHGGDSKKLREEINKCIIKTLCAVQPLLKHSYRSCQSNDYSNNKCFEILGFDILLDQNLKPWLLEVNHSPSFTTDTPFDHSIKYGLLRDVFRIIKLNPMKRVKYYQKRAEQQLFETSKKTRGKTAEERIRKMQKRDKYELENSGGFTRIYPDNGSEQYYALHINMAQQLWDEITGAKKGMELLKKKAILEEKKKRHIVKLKTQVKPPANRKPLYYLNPNRTNIRRKIEAQDLIAIQMVLEAEGYKSEVQEEVLKTILSEANSKEEGTADTLGRNISGELPYIGCKPQIGIFLLSNTLKGTADIRSIMQKLQEEFPQLAILPSSYSEYRIKAKAQSAKKAKKPWYFSCNQNELQCGNICSAKDTGVLSF